MNDYVAFDQNDQGYKFQAEDDDAAEAKVQPIFKKKGLTLTRLDNKTVGTSSLYGAKAVEWLYSDDDED